MGAHKGNSGIGPVHGRHRIPQKRNPKARQEARQFSAHPVSGELRKSPSARGPKPRRVLYLGHGPQTVTDLYEWAEVKKYLEEDAARVRKLIGEDERMLRLV